MSASQSRMPLIDALKAAASQLIVLHHLAFYGPMSDAAHDLAPAFFKWLYEDARIAVQVFLVVGGFLAAKSLTPRGATQFAHPLLLAWDRYGRLVLPLLAAIGLAIACAAIARAWMPLESSVPAAPGMPQLLAHVLLLQNLLGYEALSAGIWYVAIDFQLFVLMVALLWLARRAPAAGAYRHLALVLVSALTIASLFHFNRDAAWDDWALYFFGAYGLGVLAFWASGRERLFFWLGAIAAMGLAALLVDFRSRIAVALLVALLLGCTRSSAVTQRWLEVRPLVFLGRISYSVFLVHYPVCLVVNAAFARFAPGDPLINAFGLLLAWNASILAGALLHRYVEQSVVLWQSRFAALWLALKSAVAR
jgi:peptidoglycan/LPS O-acetylase OafA/YrhL